MSFDERIEVHGSEKVLGVMTNIWQKKKPHINRHKRADHTIQQRSEREKIETRMIKFSYIDPGDTNGLESFCKGL